MLPKFLTKWMNNWMIKCLNTNKLEKNFFRKFGTRNLFYVENPKFRVTLLKIGANKPELEIGARKSELKIGAENRS